MSRGRRKLLLTHCGMRDAGCMWTRILNKIPYKNQSRCFLVCCCWMGHVFPCLMAVDQWGKIFLDSLSFSTVYPSAGWPCDWKKGGVVLAAVPPEVQICQQDVIYLFFSHPSSRHGIIKQFLSGCGVLMVLQTSLFLAPPPQYICPKLSICSYRC